MADSKMFTRARARVRATQRVLGHDTHSDFRMSTDRLGSIFGNAASTQSGLGSSLTAHNARIAKGMSRLATRTSKAVGRDISRGADTAENMFGAAGAGAARTNLLSGKGAAKSTSLSAKADARAGKALARAGNEAMGIQQSATQEAASGADYALASALSHRNQADAAQVADQQFQLQQDRQAARLQQAYLDKQNAGSQGFGAAAQTLQDIVANNATMAEAQRAVDSMALQYQLGPSEKARLGEMLKVLYPSDATGSSATVTSSEQSLAFTKSQGMSPAAMLPPAIEQAANNATGAYYRKNPNATLDTNAALEILGVEVGADGKYISTASQAAISETMVQAGVAYIFTTWARLQAQAAAEAGGSAPAPKAVGTHGSANVGTK